MYSRGARTTLVAIDLVEELSFQFCVIKKNSFHKTISDLGKFLHLHVHVGIKVFIVQCTCGKTWLDRASNVRVLYRLLTRPAFLHILHSLMIIMCTKLLSFELMKPVEVVPP